MKLLAAYFYLLFTDLSFFLTYGLCAFLFSGTIWCWLSLVRDKIQQRIRLLISFISFIVSHIITCAFLALELNYNMNSIAFIKAYLLFISIAVGVYLIISVPVEGRKRGA